MTADLVLQVITAFLADFPEVLNAVKDLIAAIEGQTPTTPLAPLGPQVATDTQALETQLTAPPATSNS